MVSGNNLSALVSSAEWTHFSQFCSNFGEVPKAELKEDVINPSGGALWINQGDRCFNDFLA